MTKTLTLSALMLVGLALAAVQPAFATRTLTEDELNAAFIDAVKNFNRLPAADVNFEGEDTPNLTKPTVVEADDVQQMLQKTLEKQANTTLPEAAPQVPKNSRLTAPGASIRPMDEADVTVLMDQSTRPLYEMGTEIALSELRILVDMENVTLGQAINVILKQAQDKSGAWRVKWRLKPAHEYVLREKVNLTAETTFGEFMSFLADRVNNMTGVQLFTRVFEGARVIVISDTYR